MTSETDRFPFYIRIPIVFLGLALIITGIFLGQQLLVPIVIAFLIAILLRPVATFLNVKLKFPQLIANLTALIFFIICVFALMFFVYWNVLDIAHDWEKIKSHMIEHFNSVQVWIGNKFNVSRIEQQAYIEQTTDNFKDNGGRFLGNTLNTFSNFFVSVFLIPVVVFLIMLYENLFVKFLYKAVHFDYHVALGKILCQIKTVILSYLVGILTQLGIVAALTSIGLFILGVEYALLLGLITGILNLIPYIGILVSFGIAVFATLINESELTNILGVAVLFVVVQIVDNNFLVPKIVGNKVQINALASILGIVFGGMIAGIAGMFLALPVIAITKVIFDHIPELSPWGFLLGDDQDDREKGWQALRKRSLIKK